MWDLWHHLQVFFVFFSSSFILYRKHFKWKPLILISIYRSWHKNLKRKNCNSYNTVFLSNYIEIMSEGKTFLSFSLLTCTQNTSQMFEHTNSLCDIWPKLCLCLLRDADETKEWIEEKNQALNTDNYGHDLASVQALQRKHEGFERDLAALGDKVRLSFTWDYSWSTTKPLVNVVFLLK